MCKYYTEKLKEDERDYQLLYYAAEGTCKECLFYNFNHKQVSFKVVSISRVKSRVDTKASDPKFPFMMLFHGTHAESIEGILKTGFRLPPQGTHVYLTPSSSYAFRFCFSCDMMQQFEVLPSGQHKVKLLVCAIAVSPKNLLTICKKSRTMDLKRGAASPFKRYLDRFSVDDRHLKYDSEDRVINVGPIIDRGERCCIDPKLKTKVDEYCVLDPNDVIPSYVIEYEVSWTRCDVCWSNTS